MEPNFDKNLHLSEFVEELLKDENDSINEKIFFMQKRKQRLTKKFLSEPKNLFEPAGQQIQITKRKYFAFF